MKGIDEHSKMRNLRHYWKSFKNQEKNLKLDNKRMSPDLQVLSDPKMQKLKILVFLTVLPKNYI
jgi:hypothetical protein